MPTRRHWQDTTQRNRYQLLQPIQALGCTRQVDASVLAGAFEDAVRAWRAGGGAGRVWIAVESLYSMDGDFAPLDDLQAVAEAHDA